MVSNISQKTPNAKLSLITGNFGEQVENRAQIQTSRQYTELYAEGRSRILVCKLLPNQTSESYCHIHSVKQITVLCGYAELILPKICIKLFEGQLFKIPNGTKHKIVNLGKIPLKYAEIRTGPYVFDDDILV